MKVLVGSTNPVKVRAAEKAFRQYFEGVEVEGREVESRVCAQPRGIETFQGAENRASALKGEGDYLVGIEGGIIELYSRNYAFGAVYVIGPEGRTGSGTTSLFELPREVMEKIDSGLELGEAIDQLTGEKDIKYSGGAVGYFTKGRLDREKYYLEGITMALIPFI